ncbi:MAG: MBL fold metallo-hydrolase [Actinobacteria bacterium]|nr:MBL fold metallo-hydrolase [Actinomycetota bacterium]
MIEEVMPNLYRLEIPLPNIQLKALNSYIIKGEERNLIIDTGSNHLQCLEAMHSGLKELGVDLRETDVLITHYHSDHAGLVPSLMTDTSTFYCSEQDFFKLFSNVSNDSDYRDDIRRIIVRHGFPETQLDLDIDSNIGFRYRSPDFQNNKTLIDGDIIYAGNYRFRCIGTPGHTIGHMCLYEPDSKLLVAGDHILDKITPNISLASDDRNPLKEYLHSLEKVENLDIDLALPGHRNLVTNCRERILELKHHYVRRSDEILALLGEGDKTNYQVATELKWDLNCESWELFPPKQKLFAVWETLAHLKYLEEKQVIEREVRDQKVVFSLKQ